MAANRAVTDVFVILCVMGIVWVSSFTFRGIEEPGRRFFARWANSRWFRRNRETDRDARDGQLVLAKSGEDGSV